MSTTTETAMPVDDDVARNLARAATLAALTGAFAYVSFPNPVSPAPVTLQVLGVFLAGIMLGPVWGAGSMALYLLAGALGAPIYAGGEAGVGALFGATGGYLWSYPVAAAAIGWVVHCGPELRELDSVSIQVLVGAMVLGTAIIYAMGILGLMLVLGMGPVEAFVAGAAAFIPAEAFKIAAAVGVVRSEEIAAT